MTSDEKTRDPTLATGLQNRDMKIKIDIDSSARTRSARESSRAVWVSAGGRSGSGIKKRAGIVDPFLPSF